MIVDYLQLMQATTTNRDANRVQEVSEISRGLKALARELSVPVIALSRQLSRQPEMRESKEPRLSDLRESGAIEQDADLVMFLWRDKERGEDDQDTDGEVVNLKLAKHRNGPTGEIQLWFKKRQTRFVSYAGERFAEGPGRQPDAGPSYSKPIFSSTWYSTISPSWTTAVDFTTSTVWMLRTVFDAGRDRLARGVAPRLRARADHLPDDDDAHRVLHGVGDREPSLVA